MRTLSLCVALVALGCGSGGPSNNNDLSNSGSTDLAGGGGSGGGGGGSHDMAMSSSGDMATSGLCCGQPGDTGNQFGVGKYCNGFGDCSGQMASLCASLGDPKLHFCTMTCTASDMSGNCGTGATCQCQGGQCGCFPDACQNMPATC
jgi:hypothetical protein